MFFNRFMALFSALVLCCFLCVPAIAVDEVEIGESVPVAVETVPDDKQVVVNVVMPAASETVSDSSVDGEASSPLLCLTFPALPFTLLTLSIIRRPLRKRPCLVFWLPFLVSISPVPKP